MVGHALRGNEDAKQKWRENVVQGWFDKTDEPASAFLGRANKFLSDPEHSIGGMIIFESVVETQSYVVFIKLSGLAAFLLMGYLEARKLDFASAAGAAGGGRSLLHGFTSFVSSEGHAFSLNKTGLPALHVIVEGLQGMLHLAHTCWEMMGPVKTAQAFLLSEEKEDEEITSVVDPLPKQPLTEPLDTVSQVRLRGHVPRTLPRLLHTCPHTTVYVSYTTIYVSSLYMSSYCVAGAGARRRRVC
jgi:hypothetical protein